MKEFKEDLAPIRYLLFLTIKCFKGANYSIDKKKELMSNTNKWKRVTNQLQLVHVNISYFYTME